MMVLSLSGDILDNTFRRVVVEMSASDDDDVDVFSVVVVIMTLMRFPEDSIWSRSCSSSLELLGPDSIGLTNLPTG